MLCIKENNINDFNYPVILGKSQDLDFISSINNEIYQDILCFKDIVENEGIDEAYTEYQVNFNKNEIVSISIESVQLVDSHYITYINTYNYDIGQNKKLRFSDFFNIDPKYIDKFYKDIKRRICIELSLSKGEEFTDFISNMGEENFYINEDKITICFSSYELGLGFIYPLEIDINYVDYRDYLSEYALRNICRLGV